MKINTISTFFFYFLIISCTKDRVANPDSLNVPQSIIYSENFDSVFGLPAGWSVDASGWKIDSAAANVSINYSGASGKNNIEISNPTTGLGGDFNLESKNISTLLFQKITIIYGARKSKHYSDNGSTMILSYSIDDGNNWTAIPYSENPNDSQWYLVNNGARISLPANAANQTKIKFRWTAHLVATPSGSYRIDDFQILGTGM